jgi:signal peptidase II
VDFIDYNRWFIGNVADIWIVSAAALVVILALLGIGVDGRRDHGGPAARTVASDAGTGDGETASESPANGETDLMQQPRGSTVSTDTTDTTDSSVRRETNDVRRQGDDHA